MQGCTSIRWDVTSKLKDKLERIVGVRTVQVLAFIVWPFAALSFLIKWLTIGAAAAAGFGIISGNLTVGEIIANIKKAGVELGIPQLVNSVKQSFNEGLSSLGNELSSLGNDFIANWWLIVIFFALVVLAVVLYNRHYHRRQEKDSATQQVSDWGPNVDPNAEEGWLTAIPAPRKSEDDPQQ